MKKVTWTSPDGYIRSAMLRDDDPDETANMGIPCDPPDINNLDWEAVKRDLHNVLAKRNLIEMADIRYHPELLKSAAQDVLYKRLIALYQITPFKEEEHG
jgi:hypothetical protein